MEKKLPTLVWKKTKEANCIAIGGMVSAGKTTLVDYLKDKYKFMPIYELEDDKNDLMYILLDRMYKREKIASSVCQLQFLLSRFEKYKLAVNKKDQKTIVFDRTIFEDRIFAFHNMLDEPTVFNYYEQIWKDKVSELIYNVGVPKLYVILDISWDLFKKRIFQRGREMEIENFEKNEEYFMLLNKGYVDNLINVCNCYCIPYVVINASLSQDEKNRILSEKMAELKII